MKIFNYNENYTLKLVHNQYNICMSQSIHEWFDECILYKTFRIIHFTVQLKIVVHVL